MIYLDTSVALAQLLSEDRTPPVALWSEPLVVSRLLEYELWTRIHARGLGISHGGAVQSFLQRVAFVEPIRPVLERALEPFPISLRTLDALHLASASFLSAQGVKLRIASYDDRMCAAARKMKLALYPL
jgi:predicted nucleic acid-binding protein